MNEDINVTFIIPPDCSSENECSDEMQLAFTACEQHSGGGLKAQWVHQANWDKFDGLTKKDVFVLAEFDGDFYEKLRSTKCLLVGPRCLSCCLMEGTAIPAGPVFTVAMRGLVITASGMTKQQKEDIKKKVQWMGGQYFTVLAEDSTHLISNTVLSDKYIKAVERNIPVMGETWVDAVWEASLHLNINGASSDFNEYRLPTFANLQVTTTGLSKKEKLKVMKLINENGGTFTGAFQSEGTDVVVLTKDGVGSEKYKAGLEYGKACVLPSWVIDSAAMGVCLPFIRYRVAGASTSSPLAEHRLPDMSLNFSRITNVRPPSNFVDESRSINMSAVSGRMKLSQEGKKSHETSVDKEMLSEFEKFDMSCIKEAGPIFDGFCIWITGLEGICRERAAACVSRCGGVRYDCPHERVTHALAGTTAAASAALAALPAVPVLSPLWLLRSVRAGRALDETEYLIENKVTTPVKSSARKPRVEPASPMSKRNLQLLRRKPLDLPPPTPEVAEPHEQHDDIVNHYLSQIVVEPQEKTPEPPEPAPEQPNITEDITEQPTEEVEQIFRGIKIEVNGLDEEAICEIGAEVAAAGGLLVASGAGGDYVLVPLDWDATSSPVENITVFWIKDCLSQQELLPIQYYHRPVKLPQWDGPGPLEGVVASLSTYCGFERAFLDELAKLLGAVTQLRFCRRNTANALASTHLICPTPIGDKYQGAVKWKLPAVNADWLLECARTGTRVSESDYLVGDTRAPVLPIPQEIPKEQPAEQTHKQIEIEQEDATKDAVDKENAMLPPKVANVPRRGSVPSREQTPKGKITNDADMSPASRYIAMARQGLFGGESQETPKRLLELKDDARQGDAAFQTPPLDDALSTPNLMLLSPTSRRRLQAIKRGEIPSDSLRTPVDPFEKKTDTPDSAFGAILRPDTGRLTPESRKCLWKVVQDLPSKPQTPTEVTHHATPLSEIRNRFLAQFSSDTRTPPSDHAAVPRKLHLGEDAETPPSKMAKFNEEQCAGGVNTSRDNDSTKSASSTSSSLPAAVDAQLQLLSAALTGRPSLPRKRTRVSVAANPGPEIETGPESQPNTVGWDDTTPVRQVKRFMLSSNVENHEEIAEMIRFLGGEVSEGGELDLEATHLLCSAPGRSEKMLGSVAAGKWVLHPAYVARSRAVGKFLPEEEYEWGNPLATCLPTLSGAEKTLGRAAYRWRSSRAMGRPGPFAGMTVLLHMPAARKRLLAKLLEVGEGTSVDDEPPYTNDSVQVCFADIKRCPLSDRDAAWLVSKRIPVCLPVLLSSYLTEDVPPNPVEHCLPDYRPK
ncbi:DNA topoisomerase 2-binding protein 1 [Maniola jurtina]|uniref:DNA topoisomerase 2-binding protein 1 n=1 Tax=Maniola jurtina TaxID=191418 RepID=UPI001E68D749|nr:DNA topoisomerase 2-binding protein 1 [Maniola jurtina]